MINICPELQKQEEKKPRISRDDDASMEDVAGDPVVVVVAPGQASANVDGSTDAAASLLVSVKPTIAADADREIVRQLHPIVFKLEPYEDTDSLCKELDGVELLQQSSSIASARKEDILIQLFTVYKDARNREAAKVQVIGNVDDDATNFRLAAIEIRHAVLHAKLKTIDADLEMMIYTEGVADVQSPGDVCTVIIRREDREFWERCIELSSNNFPVCGVGNPGIGKTTTTIYLLQRLIHQNKPVVYTIRRSQPFEKPEDDIFYELNPVMDDQQKVKDVNVKVYKILHKKVYQVPVLKNKRAVYVVDPGDFDGSCDASRDLTSAQFIMNASNDDKHWGGENFTKLRQGDRQDHWPAPQSREQKIGKLIHGSLWTGRELILAKPYLRKLKDLHDDELLRRFRIVGGSIRDIFEFDEPKFTDKVAAALNIQDVTVQGLVQGTYQFSYKPGAPSSVLVGLGPLDRSLERQKISLKSDYVEEQLAKRHLKISWYAFLNEDNAGNRGNMFESFLREKFSSAAMHYPEKEVRESLRTKPASSKPSKEIKNYKPVAGGMTIGSKRIIIRVSNMNERVQTDHAQQYMFYSKNQSEPLVDMIFRVDGGYDSVQSTVGKKHGSARDKIRTLKTDLNLKDDEILRIFFVVPENRYTDFVTDPVNPLYEQEDLKNVRIFHVSISNDNLPTNPQNN